MKEHTPTPWFDDGYRIYGYTDHEDKRRGKVIVEHKHVDDFNPADAELIITAVNMHAELVAALEIIANGDYDNAHDLKAAANIARFALVKVKEKKCGSQ